jgi:hypothetical protein
VCCICCVLCGDITSFHYWILCEVLSETQWCDVKRQLWIMQISPLFSLKCSVRYIHGNGLCIVECTTSNSDILTEKCKTSSVEKCLKTYFSYAFTRHILEFLFF